MLVYINSETDRQPTDSTSDFSVYFKNPIELPDESNIALKSIQIPNIAQLFKESSSILWISTNSMGDQSQERALAVHIDFNKFYNDTQSIIDELNSQTSALLLPITFSIVNDKIAVTNTHSSTDFRVISNRIYEPTFTGEVISNGVDLNPNNIEYPLFNQANNQLGFIGDLRNVNIPPNATYIPAGYPRLIRSNCFYLESNIINYTNVLGNPNISKNIIAKIPMTAGFGHLICKDYENPTFYKISDNSIDVVKFTLLDDELEQVDLNGHHITLTLEILY